MGFRLGGGRGHTLRAHVVQTRAEHDGLADDGVVDFGEFEEGPAWSGQYSAGMLLIGCRSGSRAMRSVLCNASMLPHCPC